MGLKCQDNQALAHRDKTFVEMCKYLRTTVINKTEISILIEL